MKIVKHRQPGNVIDWKNDTATAIAAGSVIVIGTRVGVAVCGIPANSIGAVNLTGVYDLPKGTGAIAKGALIYYGAENVSTNAGTPYVGRAIEAAASDDDFVRVLLGDAALTPAVKITTQPTDKTVTAGAITGEFEVDAVSNDDSAITYAWYSVASDTNTGGSAVTGATSKKFTIPTDKTAATYYYYCVATSATAGTATSDAVTLTVNAAS